jgi:hypothetical protein
VMLGSVIGDGEIDEDSGDSSCTFGSEFDEVEIRTTGFIDLQDLRNNGQALVPGDESGRVDEYRFVAAMENRLFDSRSVGAVSGGDGGGYENLTLDKNDVFIKGATIQLSSENNHFAFDGGGSQSFPDWERERQTNMLVTSGGGAATVDVPIIAGSTEREQFQTFFNNISDALGDGEMLNFIFEIQLHGETMAGNRVNSNILEYPITICNGCDRTTDALCSVSN